MTPTAETDRPFLTTHAAYLAATEGQTVRPTGKRVRAGQVRAGWLIRKPRPYRGYAICEWTRIARVERDTDRNTYVFYGVDGEPVDGYVNGRASSWPAVATFEVGMFTDEDTEQDARTYATVPELRGWHKPGEPLATAQAPEAPRVPFALDRVLYLDKGTAVYALWTSDPGLWAAGAQAVWDALLRRDVETEVIATARKFIKREGATFTGWVAEYGIHSTDPMATKRQAVRELKRFTAERFTKRTTDKG